MNIPQQLTAGDSTSWIDAPARDITSAQWSLAYTLRGSTGLTLTAVAEGDGWKTSITAAQSSQLVAGVYSWQAAASKGADRITLAHGSITVLPNLAFTGTAAAYDGRSQAQIDLDAVRAEMRARITGGSVAEYTIGNRSLKKIPMPDLIALENKLKTDVALENRRKRIDAGQDSGRATFVRFGGR